MRARCWQSGAAEGVEVHSNWLAVRETELRWKQPVGSCSYCRQSVRHECEQRFRIDCERAVVEGRTRDCDSYSGPGKIPRGVKFERRIGFGIRGSKDTAA